MYGELEPESSGPGEEWTGRKWKGEVVAYGTGTMEGGAVGEVLLEFGRGELDVCYIPSRFYR